jgi:hypothetical protein
MRRTCFTMFVRSSITMTDAVPSMLPAAATLS